jgi:hypothetical protein
VFGKVDTFWTYQWAVTEILPPLFRHTAWARAISAACIRAYAAFSK